MSNSNAFHNPKNCKQVFDSNFRRPPAYAFSHSDRFRAGDIPKNQGADQMYNPQEKTPGPYWSFGKAGPPASGHKNLATSNDLLQNDLSKAGLANSGCAVFGTGLRDEKGITDPVVYLGRCSPGPAGYNPSPGLGGRSCSIGMKTKILGSTSQTGPYIAPGQYPIVLDVFKSKQPVFSFCKAPRAPKAIKEMDALTPPKMPQGSMGPQVSSEKKTAPNPPFGGGTRDQQLKTAPYIEQVPENIRGGPFSEELMEWNRRQPYIPELPLYKDSIKFGCQVPFS